MKRTRNLAALLMTALLLLSVFGCTNVQTETEPVAEKTAEQPAAEAQADAAVVYEVQSVDGSTLTVLPGTLSAGAAPEGMPSPGDGQTPPEMPTGEQPTGDGQTPPEMPTGEQPTGDGQTPPEMLSGGFAGGAAFTASSEQTRTVTVTDATVITVSAADGETAGVLSDITEGAILDIVFGDGDVAVGITVRSMQGMPGNPGGGFGSDGTTDNGTAATTLAEDAVVSKESYTSAGDDENALRVDGAVVTMDGVTVEKTGGASSNTENGDFYGMNAGVLACNGATLTVTGGTVTTDAVNGNGVFSYGTGTTVNLTGTVIRTQERNSGGIQTTGGGTTNAFDLDVETDGASSAAIRSDRGGGTVAVTGGTFVTNGTGSPAIYSTADITVTDAVLTAHASEAVVIEGKNSVALSGCTVSGSMQQTGNENVHGVMIYQSMSGDAEVGQSSFSADACTLSTLSGDLFYVTNTACVISLTNCTLVTADGVLIRVAGNDSARGWGTAGANGGVCTLLATAQVLSGDIAVDGISSLTLTLSDGSFFTGTLNGANEAGALDLTLEAGCTMTLTGDSYVSSFSGDTADIVTNGFHLYVGGVAVV